MMILLRNAPNGTSRIERKNFMISVIFIRVNPELIRVQIRVGIN